MRGSAPRLSGRGFGILGSGASLAVTAALLDEGWLLGVSCALLIAPIAAFLYVSFPRQAIRYGLSSLPVRSFAPAAVRITLVCAPTRRWAGSRDVQVLVNGSRLAPTSVPFLTRPAETSVVLQALERGVHIAGPVSECITDPLGCARRSRQAMASREIMVWPRVVEVDVTPLYLCATALGGRHDLKRSSGEIDRLREYAAGDDPRRIHWRSSARHATLLLREELDLHQPTVLLALEGGTPSFELAVSVTASLAVALLDSGVVVALRLPGLSEDLSARGEFDALDALARVEPGAEPVEDKDLARYDTVIRVSATTLGTPAIESRGLLRIEVGPNTAVQRLDDLQRFLYTLPDESIGL